jgi:hypothetical protein
LNGNLGGRVYAEKAVAEAPHSKKEGPLVAAGLDLGQNGA